MPITESDLDSLSGGNVVTTSGDKIGSIGQIYLDDQTGEPSFVATNAGLLGTSQSLIPTARRDHPRWRCRRWL
jgi:sporulation protein YlmC with PRC-barrel domain